MSSVELFPEQTILLAGQLFQPVMVLHFDYLVLASMAFPGRV